MDLATHMPLMMLRNRNMAGFVSSSSSPFTFGVQTQHNMFQENMFDHHPGLLEMAQNTGETDVTRVKDDDNDSKSGSDNLEGLSGDDQNPNDRKRKKRYHRHTQRQIQEMEAFFKECPHPDDKQRKELGKELGLAPLQVKFWFQNKRTQMKTQQERHENQQLRSENERLRKENLQFKEALAHASCPTCGGPITVSEMTIDESNLRMENARLREEIDRISAIAAKYVGKPMLQLPSMSSQVSPHPLELVQGNLGMQHGVGTQMYGVSGVENFRPFSGTSEADKPMIVELAVSGMEELLQMAHYGEPLWVQGLDSGFETLNEEEYLRMFPGRSGCRPLELKSEASRGTAVVIMNPVNLVELLMDVSEWSSVFSSIVSRAMTLDVLSTGVAGNYNGALQVMSAEFQVPSPFVPTRESFFVRYCKQHTEGTWAVVDVTLDHLRPSPSPLRCRRLPSGCLVQELPNGYSKVVWVEHVEVDDRAVPDMYKRLINSSLAFGAKRWVSTLDRQCERMESLLVANMPSGEAGVIQNLEGRKRMLKLSERMVMSFCSGVSASSAHTWTTLAGSGGEDVRVMTRKSIDDPGRPPGIVLSAATSFWLPVPPKRIFDFLRDETNRHQWDVLSSGGDIQEVARVSNGRDPGNCVTLLGVNATNPNQSNMLIMQESIVDAAGSFVVYAPVDVVAMNMVLNGGNPDYVPLLPSGFAILPDGTTMNRSVSGENECGGSILTVGFQILVNSIPTAKLSLGSVATVNTLIAATVQKVKASFGVEDT